MGELKAPVGRVIVRVDMQVKNWHTFSFGMKIRHERGFNNLNYRETQPVQGEVIDSTYIPEGSIIIFQHNATHPYYQIFNYKPLSGADIASEMRYFSIPETACYLYRPPGGDRWLPLEGFATGLRVFKPYKGLIQGIEAQQLKDMLYVTSGHLKGQVVQTVRAADYQVVCLGLNGQEENIIRFRHWEHPSLDNDGREEVIVVLDHYTRLVQKGDLHVGITTSDARALDKSERSNITYYDDFTEDLNQFVDFKADPNKVYDSEKGGFDPLSDEMGKWKEWKK